MFYKNLVKYIKLPVKIVERRILEALSDQFTIVFDGWNLGSTNYIAVFATFTSDNSVRYQQVLLRFASLENEETRDAAKHFSFVSYALRAYGKTFDSVATDVTQRLFFVFEI